MDFRIELDLDALRQVKALGGSLPKVMQRGVERVLFSAAEGVQMQARERPRVRSGRLVGSWTPRRGTGDQATEMVTRRTSTGAYGWVRPQRLKYADIHATGGVVTATKGKYLSIPLGPAKTAAGVARKKSPRDYPDLFFITSKKGNKLLVKRKGKGKLEPFFLLVESVNVPATNYIDRGVKRNARRYSPIMDETIHEEIRKRRLDT